MATLGRTISNRCRSGKKKWILKQDKDLLYAGELGPSERSGTRSRKPYHLDLRLALSLSLRDEHGQR